MTFSFGTKLETWSKQKTFFLLILLIGVGVHILFNLLYIYVLYDLYEKYDLSFQVIAETLILLIPCIFIFFSTFIFTKKNIGFLNRIAAGFMIFIFQICLFAIITTFFVVLVMLKEGEILV